ncbi:hypothetical protein FBT96_17675 [Rhodobacter capsulatus]|uniref:Uncharacterized protein n=1 Tax=Rhodobacter capsulatus TaxID=1061 RepID=A0A4U1JLT7_RHOCA|nr:hypothetical protein [Rhodobacter capsulatus]TKD14591.1 hypothetical protein FBT96_17675 [Rhodobacter capsulatus]
MIADHNPDQIPRHNDAKPECRAFSRHFAPTSGIDPTAFDIICAPSGPTPAQKTPSEAKNSRSARQGAPEKGHFGPLRWCENRRGRPL